MPCGCKAEKHIWCQQYVYKGDEKKKALRPPKVESALLFLVQRHNPISPVSWPDLQDYGEKMTSVSMGGGVVLCLDFLFVYFSSLPIFQMSVLFFLPFESFFQLLCHRGGGGGTGWGY